MKNQNYLPERRPLAARNWNASQVAAEWLAARKASPNAISIMGLLVSVGAGAALANSSAGGRPWLWLVLACLLILARGMCNMLDGMVAIASGKASRGGELFNEVPDRISDSAILIGAGYVCGGIPELGYVAAIAAVFTAYVRVQGCSLGTKADFCGPMAKIHRMVVVVIAALYTAFTPAAWQPTISGLPGAGAMAIALAVIIIGCAVTSLHRLRRIAHFLTNQPR